MADVGETDEEQDLSDNEKVFNLLAEFVDQNDYNSTDNTHAYDFNAILKEVVLIVKHTIVNVVVVVVVALAPALALAPQWLPHAETCR